MRKFRYCKKKKIELIVIRSCDLKNYNTPYIHNLVVTINNVDYTNL